MNPSSLIAYFRGPFVAVWRCSPDLARNGGYQSFSAFLKNFLRSGNLLSAKEVIRGKKFELPFRAGFAVKGSLKCQRVPMACPRH